MSIYYVSPSNYTLYNFDTPTVENITKKQYTIEPNNEKIIKYSKIKNKKLRIYNDEIELIPVNIYNKFKSENICIDKNKLIKLNNSDLIIKNKTIKPIDVQIEYYYL